MVRTRAPSPSPQTSSSASSPVASRPVTRPPALREVALYPAIKRFLSARGFTAKGEVAGCDVVGLREGEPPGLVPIIVIVEMKLGFTLDLVLQGVDRLSAADEVWLAVRATGRGRDRDRRTRQLCRLLGFGLLAVHAARNDVEVLAEPEPYRPRVNLKRRKALLTEHRGRRGDPSPGGTRGTPIVTVYRQQALDCAALLAAGPGRPRDLRAVAPDAANILQRDVYGWFTRVSRGLYGLTDSGRAALIFYAPKPDGPTVSPTSG